MWEFLMLVALAVGRPRLCVVLVRDKGAVKLMLEITLT